MPRVVRIKEDLASRHSSNPMTWRTKTTRVSSTTISTRMRINKTTSKTTKTQTTREDPQAAGAENLAPARNPKVEVVVEEAVEQEWAKVVPTRESLLKVEEVLQEERVLLRRARPPRTSRREVKAKVAKRAECEIV